MIKQITSTNMQLKSSAMKLAEEKLSKIEKFVSEVGEDLKEVRMIINRGPNYGYLVKLELFVPNNTFVAKSAGFRMISAIDDSIEEVIRQVNKFKGKISKKDRKLIRNFKRSLFFSKLEDQI